MENASPKRDNINNFNTWEEFLDSQITPLDLYYLEDEDLARELIELGYRGNGEILKVEDFLARKQAHEATKLAKKNQLRTVNLALDIPPEAVLMKELASREDLNRQGIMATIIFVRDYNSRRQEISGYIDYAQRLRDEDFVLYFNGTKKLLPQASDLSFFNWETQMSTSNSSDNYQVITDNHTGLLFKNKKDKKALNPDPNVLKPGENTLRIDLTDSNYLHVVLFDHVSRRK